jgi:enoyl-CoA hydratase
MSSDYILYEKPEPGIARIVLNRPDTANAQDTQLLYELNDAFNRASREDDVRVIILAAAGKHFSSGHDMRERDHHDNQDRYEPVTPCCQHPAPARKAACRAKKSSTPA